jgi:hypothetical protein
MPSVPRLLRSACAIAMMLCAPLHALAEEPTSEEKESARGFFRSGDDLFRAGDYAAALESFEAADAIMKVPTTGLEVARTLAKLGRLIEARAKLRAVIGTPPDDLEARAMTDARAEATALLGDLELRIPSIEVRVAGSARSGGKSRPKAVAVQVDGEDLPGSAALLPHQVDPGSHRVVVSALGYERAEHEVNLVDGEKRVLTVELAPAALPTFDPDEDPVGGRPGDAAEEPGLDEVGRTVAVVAIGVGLGAIVGGAITGAVTLVEADALEEACPDKRCRPEDEGLLDRTVTLSHVATAMLVLGGVATTAGVIALVVAGGGEDDAEARLVIGPGYAGAAGRF